MLANQSFGRSINSTALAAIDRKRFIAFGNDAGDQLWFAFHLAGLEYLVYVRHSRDDERGRVFVVGVAAEGD